MKLYSKLLAKGFLLPFTILFSREKSKFVYLFSFKYKVKNWLMLHHISISIFQVLQCTSFLSKLLTLVESGTITTMKYIYSNLFLILESIEHYVSLVNNYLRKIRGFTHVFLLGNICIRKSSAFEVLCLNPHVLQTALSALNNLRGDKIDIKFFLNVGVHQFRD